MIKWALINKQFMIWWKQNKNRDCACPQVYKEGKRKDVVMVTHGKNWLFNHTLSIQWHSNHYWLIKRHKTRRQTLWQQQYHSIGTVVHTIPLFSIWMSLQNETLMNTTSPDWALHIVPLVAVSKQQNDVGISSCWGNPWCRILDTCRKLYEQI